MSNNVIVKVIQKEPNHLDFRAVLEKYKDIVTSFLTFKSIKSLYFSYSIVNFTTLNGLGITSLHLLTTRVGLLLLKSVRLFLQTTGVAQSLTSGVTSTSRCLTSGLSALHLVFHYDWLLQFS